MPRWILVAAALLASLLTVAAPAGAASRQVPRDFFGAMWDKEIQDSASPSVQSPQWRKMAASGVESTRAVFSWNLAQQQQGQTSYKYTDRLVTEATRHGLDILPVVTYAPPWARFEPTNLGSRPNESAYPAYAAYLKLLIARYGPHGRFWKDHPSVPYRPIRRWQIWNEPHVTYQWSPSTDWPQKYGALLRQAYRAVKHADPGAKVVLAGLANASWDNLKQLYDQGGIKGHFDVASVHFYGRNTPNFGVAARRVRSTLNSHGGKRIPIWFTEVGASASLGRLYLPSNADFQVSDGGLAHQVKGIYSLLIKDRRRYDIQRVYWYTWASSYAKNSQIFDFAGLNVFDGSKVRSKPALAAYRSIARKYEGCAKDTRTRCVRR